MALPEHVKKLQDRIAENTGKPAKSVYDSASHLSRRWNIDIQAGFGILALKNKMAIRKYSEACDEETRKQIQSATSEISLEVPSAPPPKKRKELFSDLSPLIDNAELKNLAKSLQGEKEDNHTAVQKATTVLEATLRSKVSKELGGKPGKNATNRIDRAFMPPENPDDPKQKLPLFKISEVNDFDDNEQRNIQRGFTHILLGIQRYSRNPAAHNLKGFNQRVAIAVLLLCDELIDVIDKAESCK